MMLLLIISCFIVNNLQLMISMIIELTMNTFTYKPQSHIHGFGPGRATVHSDLSNRGASA